MIIAGMNRYFARHGRIIGLVIVVIISVTFVLYFGRTSILESFMGSRNANTVSLLNRTVSVEDRRDEITRIYIWASLHNPAIDPGRNDMPLNSKTVITQMIQVFAAEDMGIEADDKQIADYIKKAPVFQTAGKFDRNKYDNYIKNKLTPAYLSVSDLKDAVRRQLQIQALRKLVTGNIIVPEGEVKEFFVSNMQTVDASIIKFNADDFSGEVKITEQDLKNYYESNKDKYKTPPAAKGLYVAFLFSSFKKAAADTVTEKEMLEYYNNNKFLYIIEKSPAAKKAKNKNTKPEYKPFIQVRDQIKVSLAEKKTKELAEAAAQKFADNTATAATDIFYDITDKKQAVLKCLELFRKKAGEKNLKPEETGWLYTGESKNSRDFHLLTDQMSKLFEDNPVSEPVTGDKAIFVAILSGKKGAVPETFEEVKDKVRKDLTANKAILLAREKARAAALELGEKLDKGVKFDDIVKSMKLKPEKLPKWPAQMLSYFKNGASVESTALTVAFATPQNSLSQAQPTRDGAYIVYVAKKNLPSEEEFSKRKAAFTMQHKMQKQEYAYQNFLNSLINASSVAEKNNQ